MENRSTTCRLFSFSLSSAICSSSFSSCFSLPRYKVPFFETAFFCFSFEVQSCAAALSYSAGGVGWWYWSEDRTYILPDVVVLRRSTTRRCWEGANGAGLLWRPSCILFSFIGSILTSLQLLLPPLSQLTSPTNRTSDQRQNLDRRQTEPAEGEHGNTKPRLAQSACTGLACSGEEWLSGSSKWL